MEKTSKKKKTVIIAVSVVLLACLCVGIGVGAASCNPNFYSTEQHIARISARVQERFIDTGAHESFTVSPLYNQNDEVNQFLVEFNDDGYLYVQTHLVYPYGTSMYITSYGSEYIPCVHVREEVDSPNEDGMRWRWAKDGIYGQDGRIYRDSLYFEVDEWGRVITWTISHFAAAGIDPSEKKYFIKTERNGYIPVVKREDKFLNLITMELGSLEELEAEEINSSNWLTIGGFTPKPDFNL